MVRRLKIHPAIGVARVGNSPDEFFIGPERPWDFEPPAGGYRDAKRRLKRQGTRFRVFVYDDGQPPRELEAAEAEVEWSVRLANTKAAGDRFHGIRRPHEGVRNPAHPRDQLVLAAAGGPIAGRDQRAELVSKRPFMGKPLTVTLGRMLSDENGHLVVLGGYGTAGSPTNTPLNAKKSNFANREGWYDDVSDGPVTAVVRMRNGSPAPPVEPAWVIVGPPKFAPALHNPVTLYDTLLQVAIDRGMVADPSKAPNFKPSFARDIYRILRRAFGIRWVYADGVPKARPERFHRFTQIPPSARNEIFGRLRGPSAVLGGHGTDSGSMPKMWSDDFPDGGNGTLTPLQYAIMKAWRDGTFDDDWTGAPPPAEGISAAGLDRAALESCVGGPMHPGIEVSYKLRDTFPFVEPFRLDAALVNPGDATAQMGVPWQSDFIDCSWEEGSDGFELTWWPAQRPIDSWTSPDGTSLPWLRSFTAPGKSKTATEMKLPELIAGWHRLGLVLENAGAYLEVDRVDQEVP
jgi:hypothetical protein